MKGMFSIAIALAMVATIFFIRSTAHTESIDAAEFNGEMQLFEERFLAEMQVKSLLSQAMQNAQGEKRDERLVDAALRITRVAEWAKEHNGRMWMGSPREEEIERMLALSLQTQTPHMCEECIPAEEYFNTIPAPLAILDERLGKIFISRNGFAHLPLALGETPGIGVTMLMRNTSFIVWAGEGFT